MRHILDGHPRGSVMNIISGCPYSNWEVDVHIAIGLLGQTIILLGHIVLAPQIIGVCSPSHCIYL